MPTALPVISLLTVPFYQRFPKVMITVLSQNSHEIEQGIVDFEIDAGLTYLDNEPLTHVRTKPVYIEYYVFLTRITAENAGMTQISWCEAAEQPLCLLTPDMQNRRIIDGIFRSVGKSPKPAMETNSIFNLCSHAAAGHWSSIVPRQLLHFFGLPEGTLALALTEPQVSRVTPHRLSRRPRGPPGTPRPTHGSPTDPPLSSVQPVARTSWISSARSIRPPGQVARHLSRE